MKLLFLLSALFFLVIRLQGQSLEVMPGTERIFVDAQWLEFLDKERKWSLFSRSRATTDDRENTNLFTGAYINYTSRVGLGGTIVGRISSLGAGSDAGLHFFKASSKGMVYALASVGLSKEASYSWFSIMRFTPSLSEKWGLYSGLELFSNFGDVGHVASVQRMRVGLSRGGVQFGVALNLSGLGPNYENTDSNPGLFLRKQF